MNGTWLSEDRTKLVAKVAQDHGFRDYTVDLKDETSKGDGYLSIIIAVVICENENPDRCLHLIAKCAPTSETSRMNSPIRRIFGREIYMYQRVFVEFRRLQQERKIKEKFTEHAKCYGALDQDLQECLVFDNLTENDYSLWGRTEPMNHDHVALVVKTYAKFHACALALKTLKPSTFKNIERNLENVVDEEGVKKSQESVKVSLKNGLRAVEGDERATAALQRYFDDIDQLFADMLKLDKYSVINHGDCWASNMMFQYKNSRNINKPTSMCLLDWQFTKLGSPMLDLACFLLSCSSKDVLYDYKKYLDIYYETLSTLLKETGCYPDTVFPKAEMNRQWKKFAKAGVFSAILIIKILLSEPGEAVVDFSPAAEDGQDINTALSETESNMDVYNERVSTMVNFMIDQDLM